MTAVGPNRPFHYTRLDTARRVACRHLMAITMAVTSSLWSATFTVTIDPTLLEVGEEASVTMQFENLTPRTAPDVSQLADFQLRYVTQSTGMQFINGRTTATISLRYSLTARRLGDLIFPALTVEANGQKYSSAAVPVKVVPVGEKAKISGQTADAFLKLVPGRPEVFVGELFPVEISLYALEGRLGPDPELSGPGFTFGPITKGGTTRENLNGRPFNRIPYTTAAIAAKTGPLSLGPAKTIFGLPDRQRVNIFGEAGLRQVTLVSEPATVNVLPLPLENRPPSFNGAVGTFSLTVTAGPTNLNVGDPVTVRIAIAGAGSLDRLTLPEQEAWREFKTYPPTSKIEGADPLGLSGTKTFEQIIVPQNADIREIAPVTFAFFDPKERAYRTARGPAIPLTVRPSAATPQPTVLSGSPADPRASAPSREIVHIKQNLGFISPPRAPLIQRPWFLALNALAPLAWLGAWTWRRQEDRLTNNPRLRRTRESARLVRQGLADLRRHATANASDDFFATTFRLLQEQIGERLDRPGPSITEEVVEERLRGRGLSSDGVALLHELFQACNQARYAPIRSSAVLASFIPRVERAIADLQRLPGADGGPTA